MYKEILSKHEDGFIFNAFFKDITLTLRDKIFKDGEN